MGHHSCWISAVLLQCASQTLNGLRTKRTIVPARNGLAVDVMTHAT